jgi:general transcriptional corepressor CYC8
LVRAWQPYSSVQSSNILCIKYRYDLGTLYESCNNQVNDAIDAYTRALELDPNNNLIKQRLHILRNPHSAQATPPSQPQQPAPQDPATYSSGTMTGGMYAAQASSSYFQGQNHLKSDTKQTMPTAPLSHTHDPRQFGLNSNGPLPSHQQSVPTAAINGSGKPPGHSSQGPPPPHAARTAPQPQQSQYQHVPPQQQQQHQQQQQQHHHHPQSQPLYQQSQQPPPQAPLQESQQQPAYSQVPISAPKEEFHPLKTNGHPQSSKSGPSPLSATPSTQIPAPPIPTPVAIPSRSDSAPKSASAQGSGHPVAAASSAAANDEGLDLDLDLGGVRDPLSSTTAAENPTSGNTTNNNNTLSDPASHTPLDHAATMDTSADLNEGGVVGVLSDAIKNVAEDYDLEDQEEVLEEGGGNGNGDGDGDGMEEIVEEEGEGGVVFPQGMQGVSTGADEEEGGNSNMDVADAEDGEL